MLLQTGTSANFIGSPPSRIGSPADGNGNMVSGSVVTGAAAPANDAIAKPELRTRLLTRLGDGFAQLRGVERGIRLAPLGLSSEPYEVVADEGDV